MFTIFFNYQIFLNIIDFKILETLWNFKKFIFKSRDLNSILRNKDLLDNSRYVLSMLYVTFQFILSI